VEYSSRNDKISFIINAMTFHKYIHLSHISSHIG